MVAMLALQVFYEGRVQGVGFRWTVRQLANGFDVTGWVRNLHDGRVELQVGGEDDEVTAFLDAIKNSELASLIRRQEEVRLESRPTARGFEIKQ
jgi:acylphosphatase